MDIIIVQSTPLLLQRGKQKLLTTCTKLQQADLARTIWSSKSSQRLCIHPNEEEIIWATTIPIHSHLANALQIHIIDQVHLPTSRSLLSVPLHVLMSLRFTIQQYHRSILMTRISFQLRGPRLHISLLHRPAHPYSHLHPHLHPHPIPR
eukprot:TRINITY_DN4943_c0_g1::TRINITY_DN4943_c0_g1_i1::g.16653::m.16653 TRINITY_DN4943_c0_g1::TRINITY_DN4943_c0_g1_i1::g.16653  ORF type:complete len:149 (-),score=-21.46,Ku/PF02735.11/0.16 TRINITY_DN4943_c0_g1_i1:104-550(-)